MQRTPSPAMPALTVAFSMAIFGTLGYFAVKADLPPFVTVFWRCVFAVLFLAVWCWVKGVLTIRGHSPRLVLQAALGGVCNLGSAVALFAAYQGTSIATATILYHVQPFFVVVIGIVFLKERVRSHEMVWLAVAFAGMVLSTGLIGAGGGASASSMTGIALALFAALLYAFGTILARGLGDQRPEISTLIQMVVGAAMLAPFADLGTPVPAESWKWLITMGIVHTGFAYALMFAAFPYLTTPVIGVLAFVFPLVSILVDWIAFDNPIGPVQWAGLGLIALGTLGVQLGWRFMRQPDGYPG